MRKFSTKQYLALYNDRSIMFILCLGLDSWLRFSSKFSLNWPSSRWFSSIVNWTYELNRNDHFFWSLYSNSSKLIPSKLVHLLIGSFNNFSLIFDSSNSACSSLSSLFVRKLLVTKIFFLLLKPLIVIVVLFK